MAVAPDHQVREAYDAMAHAYDAFTADYQHDLWVSRLEALALARGLSGRRVLDVACGTGLSFLPLLRRGYDVVGVDISPAMIARARAKAPDVPLYEADMRRLPILGRFDLVTCLEDALNYMLTVDDLREALGGIARNLRPGGMAIWDLNTLAQYDGQFARDIVIDDPGLFIGWTPRDVAVEDGVRTAEVSISVFKQVRTGEWVRSISVHRQRHWTSEDVERLAADAGLRVATVRGVRAGSFIEASLDELSHRKALYVAQKVKGGGMIGGR